MITTVAPAKINWVLEVLGKRADGYHEVRTVLQAIDLHDELTAAEAESLSVEVNGVTSGEDDLVLKAARALASHTGRPPGTAMRVVKRIPVAAGLGGGSSDAAAALRALLALWRSGLSTGELTQLASSLGSDVPFFLRGGAALAEGRGESITPLPDTDTRWIVLVTPPHRVADKTRTLYTALRPEDFSDGSASVAVADSIRAGKPLDNALLMNAFERAAFEVFEGLATYRDWLLQAGAASVHLTGAGPALYALTTGEAEARAIRARMNRARRGERVHVARTISAADSTLVWDAGLQDDTGG